MSSEHPHIMNALLTLCTVHGVTCVVQVGGEDAGESNFLRRRIGCRTIAIEANEKVEACAPGIEFHHAVIGATNCETTFYLHGDAGLSSTIRRVTGPQKGITLTQVRLDTFCETIGVTPDALIVDTEGTTLDVLEGCGALLDGLKVVYAECQTEPDRLGVRHLMEVDAFLVAHGMTQHHGLPSYSVGAQGNYTWVRR